MFSSSELLFYLLGNLLHTHKLLIKFNFCTNENTNYYFYKYNITYHLRI